MSIRNLAAALSAAACLIALTGCGQRQAGEAESEGNAPAKSAAVPQSAPDAAAETSAADFRLAGTKWRLIEFQSMDDAIGTIRPEDPSAYTLAFHENGSVAMQLNCNRATGSWSATPGEDGRSGSLEIGRLAVTKTRCPPPSMDEKIAADMDHVTGYFVDAKGRLALSLMADAGVYLWEPIKPS